MEALEEDWRGGGEKPAFLPLFLLLLSVESGTNAMALVQLRQHKVHKTKWSHLCQLKRLSVSHDTVVQEENYLSPSKHIWQVDIFAHVVRADRSAELDNPWAPGGIPHLPAGVSRHL